ncbi:peptidase HslV family [Caulobacter phage CcrSC]|uniref:Proteasome subunit beta n=1 Tax=Caulobacter phage CcrSC TaxID=2283272 RepID=A0A385EDX4_9CAUD|nr:peptidase HslV family [Caulobacter phage CcrSC]YP_009810714.1 peptidase HslV family [Caulobacter phage CcrSC]AXQ69584.1 hypothetical protein CcrSC_gp002 [Caulobacter phage CcrSC]AXQ70084.1 hypothetical protein CcrSC_gp502 [Caulobacter phage CcrSC]
MTTLAYKDGVLAADTRICDGTLMLGVFTKIRRIGPVLTAGCGNAQDVAKFNAWVSSGMEGEFSMGESECWLIAPGQPVLIYENDTFLRIDAPFYASGTGGEIARGAMAMGADAVTAVRQAILHDSATGPPIDVLYLDGRPGERLAA